MDARIRLAYLLLSVAASSAGLAQSDARIDLPQATLTAGDSFVVTVTLDVPAPCKAQIAVTFVNASKDKSIQAVGFIDVGQNSAKIDAQVPRDFPGGDYVSRGEGDLWPCPGYSNMRKFSVPGGP
jgi:hypothetical protein